MLFCALIQEAQLVVHLDGVDVRVVLHVARHSDASVGFICGLGRLNTKPWVQHEQLIVELLELPREFSVFARSRLHRLRKERNVSLNLNFLYVHNIVLMAKLTRMNGRWNTVSVTISVAIGSRPQLHLLVVRLVRPCVHSIIATAFGNGLVVMINGARCMTMADHATRRISLQALATLLGASLVG